MGIMGDRRRVCGLRHQHLTDPILHDVAARLGRLLWDDPDPRSADGPEQPGTGPDGGS